MRKTRPDISLLSPVKLGSNTKIIIPLAIISLLLLGGLFFGSPPKENPQKADLVKQGFNLIHMGQFAEAGEVFHSLNPQDASFYQGVMALALSHGDIAGAERTFSQLEKGQPGNPYSLVLEGGLALGKGDLEHSELLYKTAIESRSLEGWQRAECHYGLGRIYSVRGLSAQAAAEFDRALELDPHFVQAYTGKGLALERMGELKPAVAAFEKGSAINPDDPVNNLLYRKTGERLSEQSNAERRSRIDSLVADLVKAYREGKPNREDAADDWTSRPLYLFFTELEVQGQPAPREGQDAFLKEQIILNMNQTGGRIRLVERAMLERFLEELKLSRTELVDPETAPRLGKVLSARVMAAGSILRCSGELQINLRAIDTETGLVAAMASMVFDTKDNPLKTMQELTREFQNLISAAYPIRGRIAEIRGHEVILNVGSTVGIVPGMKLIVVEDERPAAVVTVKDVSQRSSTAVLSDVSAPLQRGWRVEGAGA